MQNNTHFPLRPTDRKYIRPMIDYGFNVICKESDKKQLLIYSLDDFFDFNIVDNDIRV